MTDDAWDLDGLEKALAAHAPEVRLRPAARSRLLHRARRQSDRGWTVTSLVVAAVLFVALGQVVASVSTRNRVDIDGVNEKGQFVRPTSEWWLVDLFLEFKARRASQLRGED